MSYLFPNSIEKDQTETTTKECSQKVSEMIYLSHKITKKSYFVLFVISQVLELQKQLEIARNQIKSLPGIDLNKEDQLQKLENLRNQLVLKQDLIKKYKDIHF